MIPSLEFVHPPLAWLPGSAGSVRHWRLRLTWGGTVSLIGTEQFLAPPEWELLNRFEAVPRPVRIIGGRLVVVVNAGDAVVEALRVAIETTQTTCAGALEALDPDGDEAHTVEVLSGVLAELMIEGGAARLTFGHGLPNAGKLMCRDTSRLDGYTGLPPGRWLPQVFGRGAFLLPSLFETSDALLLDDLPAGAKTLRLTAPVDWPPTGRVQIEDEVITYRAIAAGGEELGSVATPLLRPARRFHGRGARVVLIPETELAWVVADHAASLVEARLEDANGAVINGGEVLARDLDGIVATLLRLDRLPPAIRTSRFPVEREGDLAPGDWTILPDTTAHDPSDAFRVASPQRGAVMTTTQRLLHARYRRDLSIEEMRFDRITRANLSFEFSDTPNWDPATRLRVRVSKGASSVELHFNRDGLTFPIEVKGSGALPSLVSTGVVLRETRRVGFDRIDATGDWSNVGAAIDGTTQESASGGGIAGAQLSACFVTDPPERGLAIEGIVLHARVVNDGESSLMARLEAEVPGLMLRVRDVEVEAGAAGNVSLDILPPSNVGAAELFGETARYRLVFPTGGSVRVEEMWLEYAMGATLNAKTLTAAVTTLPTLGIVGVRLAYSRAEVDFTALIGGDLPWCFFSPDDGAPEVEFEIIDPPALSLWAVYLRDARWRWTVQPATGIRPTARLYGVVDGRGVRGDGTANPAVALRDLLSEPGLCAVPETEINVDTFTALEDLADARGVAFAAAFLEASSLGDAFMRAAGESTLAVVRARGRWSLTALPLEADGALLPSVPRGELIAGSGALRLVPQAPQSVGGLVVRDHSGGVLASDAPPIVLSIMARWLVRGGVALKRFLDARRYPSEDITGLRMDARWMATPAGTAMALPGLEQPGMIRQGELSRLAWREGECMADLTHGATSRHLFVTPTAIIQRGNRGRALRFFIEERLVAVLTDDGDLLIAGELMEGTLAPSGAFAVFVAEPGEHRLRCSYRHSEMETASWAITADGDLLTTVPVIERAGIADIAPDGAGEQRTGATLIGGKPPGAAAMRLSLASVALRGTLHTRQII